MGGRSSEQSEGVVVVKVEQRTAQVPGVGRVALCLALAAVRIDPKVHGAPVCHAGRQYSRNLLESDPLFSLLTSCATSRSGSGSCYHQPGMPLPPRRELLDRYASTHGVHFAERDAAWYAMRARYFEHRVRAWLPTSRNAAILDLACGSGEFLKLINAKGYTAAHGIDISEEQLEVARRNGIANVAREDLFDHLKTHCGAYDFVLASHIIEHMTRDQVVQFLVDLGASLRPQGMAVVLTPNAGSPLGLPYTFGDLTHELHLTGMSLAQVAAVAGLEIRHIGGIRPAGVLKSIAWGVIRRTLEAFIGDRRMTYGSIMEPELIAVLGLPRRP
jgi:SAM-dependent methyltransferase